MANQDAWNAGLAIGSGKSKKKTDKKDKKSKKGAAGKGMAAAKGAAGGNPWSSLTYLPKLSHGGKVRKTGLVIAHKGERVIPSKNRKRVEKAMKAHSIRKTTKK